MWSLESHVKTANKTKINSYTKWINSLEEFKTKSFDNKKELIEAYSNFLTELYTIKDQETGLYFLMWTNVSDLSQIESQLNCKRKLNNDIKDGTKESEEIANYNSWVWSMGETKEKIHTNIEKLIWLIKPESKDSVKRITKEMEYGIKQALAAESNTDIK